MQNLRSAAAVSAAFFGLLAAGSSAEEKLERRSFGPRPGTRVEYGARISFDGSVRDEWEFRIAALRLDGNRAREAVVLVVEGEPPFLGCGLLLVDLLGDGKPKGTVVEPLAGTMGGALRKLIFPSIEAPRFDSGTRWKSSLAFPEFEGLFTVRGTFENSIDRLAGEAGVMRISVRRIRTANPLEALIGADVVKDWTRTIVVEEETRRVLSARTSTEVEIEGHPVEDGEGEPKVVRSAIEILEEERRPLDEEERRSLPGELEALRKVVGAGNALPVSAPDLGPLGLLVGQKKRDDPMALLEAYEASHRKGILAPAVGRLRKCIEEVRAEEERKRGLEASRRERT